MVLRISCSLEFFPVPRLYRLMMKSQAHSGWSLGAETAQVTLPQEDSGGGRESVTLPAFMVFWSSQYLREHSYK